MEKTWIQRLYELFWKSKEFQSDPSNCKWLEESSYLVFIFFTLWLYCEITLVALIGTHGFFLNYEFIDILWKAYGLLVGAYAYETFQISKSRKIRGGLFVLIWIVTTALMWAILYIVDDPTVFYMVDRKALLLMTEITVVVSLIWLIKCRIRKVRCVV